jgi:enoyl-CoA hydratase/carnithine racemase
LINFLNYFYPLLAIACKEAVNAAYETTLSQGLDYEKRLFWATFATQDRKIGMESFANKKKPEWTNK